jgi:AAA+ superfamily predicted ATPase
VWESTIFDLLGRPLSSIAFEVCRALMRLRPGCAVSATDLYRFDLDDFIRAGRCQAGALPGTPYHQRMYNDERETCLLAQVRQGWRRVRWQDEDLEVLTLTFGDDNCPESFHWVISRSAQLNERFVLEVCKFDELASSRILVFEGGHFHKRGTLSDSIRAASFDDLILPALLKEDLRDDAMRFFARQADYERYRLPWKRGLLLVGPPGNGKTHAVKALLHLLDRPVLYVKSFASRHSDVQENIRSVFERARRSAPAVHVLEDVDCLIGENDRSAFLNELDGFAQNTGLLTIATTNHPERLDRSILDRPSRFDRKFHFPLPGERERRAWLARWVRTVEDTMKLSAGGLDELAARSRGFTYAYLKELTLTASLRWMDDSTSMDAVAARALEELAGQMASSAVLLGPLEQQKTTGVADARGPSED